MVYHHKRDSCAKETKEILANLLRSRCAEYALIEATEAIKVGSPFEEILSEESTTNPLRTDSEEILRREAPATVQVPGAMEDGRGTEQYTTTADIRFEFKTSANNYLRIKKGNVLGLERDDEC